MGRGLCGLARWSAQRKRRRANVRRLREIGVDFDHHGQELELALEAGHSRRRVAHAGGGGTGRVVMEAVVRRVSHTTPSRCRRHARVGARLRWRALLGRTSPRRSGARAPDHPRHRRRRELFARSTILPAPEDKAWRWRGAQVRGSRIWSSSSFTPRRSRCRVRGTDSSSRRRYAARARTCSTSLAMRFMSSAHPDAELAPRDELTRAIVARNACHRGAFGLLVTRSPRPACGAPSIRRHLGAARRARIRPCSRPHPGGSCSALHDGRRAHQPARTNVAPRPARRGRGGSAPACTARTGLASNSCSSARVRGSSRFGRMRIAVEPADVDDVDAAALGDRPPVPARPSNLPDLQSTRDALWRRRGRAARLRYPRAARTDRSGCTRLA